MRDEQIQFIFYQAYIESMLANPARAAIWLKAAELLETTDPYYHLLCSYVYCIAEESDLANSHLEKYEDIEGKIAIDSPLSLIRSRIEYMSVSVEKAHSTLTGFTTSLNLNVDS